MNLVRCHAAWLLLLCGAVGLAACGLRTQPQPVVLALPTVETISLRQQDTRLILAWQQPWGNQVHGAPEAYAVSIVRTPLDCPMCKPQSVVERRVAASGEPWMHEVLPLDPAPALWRARVQAEFPAGMAAPSPVALLEAPVQIPRHALAAEWLGPDREQVRLSWVVRRERDVRFVTAQGAVGTRTLYYRANLYRRDPGGDWPLSPINPQPIAAGSLILPADAMLRTSEFALRLVDQAGNEGPLSTPRRPAS